MRCSGGGIALGDAGITDANGGKDVTISDSDAADAVADAANDAIIPIDSGPTCTPDPENYDIPGNGCDDDGDGIVDNTITCDTSLGLTGPAGDMAKALGLCQLSSSTSWGVVAATYTKGYASTLPPGADTQHGILPTFGTNIVPREGAALGVLSSGYAREYDQCTTTTDPFKVGCTMDMGDAGASTAPPGYPKPGTCELASDVHDASALVLQIKVPKNARGFSFDFDFMAGDWPEWVCSKYNDVFVAWLTSTAYAGVAGDFNIAYDTSMSGITVNSPFLQACSPASATVGCQGTTQSTDSCSLGAGELLGTGFSDPGMHCSQTDSGGGSTGWLTTKAPATPGETMTIQFIIWDTGDATYDSSVLLDDWKWQATTPSVGTSP
jgi:hypothetical protein